MKINYKRYKNYETKINKRFDSWQKSKRQKISCMFKIFKKRPKVWQKNKKRYKVTRK